ncbi:MULTISPECIES: acyl carrier protein [unclassified Sphingomonas]|uniref:acyl carrier protein n=1 Tax=unclassified Sphingomonas TaxID=196159 RepID=UPI0028589A87|nr:MULTISPECIES: acyl carrier protein [unclassified Sphingomonas]MDR6116519.1 acyl carrier protein [Sphingomonas sp. SORGH_AS_0789]MDR6149806.1 acyl carrier protein [Sphingomonas sp. SORGH_AS_0742]
MASFLSNLINKISFAEKSSPPVELTEPNIRQWLVERMAVLVNTKPEEVDTARSFESYGLDSLAAVNVAGDLERFMDQRLSPALLFEYPNIDELSHFLAQETRPIDA